jgi:dolichol kinase
MSINVVYSICVLLCCYWVLCSNLGILANKYNIKINYTRKVGHFSMFVFPGIVYFLFNVTVPTDRIIIASVASVTFFISLLEFFRNRFKYLYLSFASIDRPEDRPHTLIWLFSQTLVGFIILAIYSYIWKYLDIPSELMYITILTTTVGDGLAEPVGVRFGKHKYEVKGFMVKKMFYRSYEGSAMVFLVALVLSLAHFSSFNFYGLMIMVLIYPITMTIVEAKSPHTWDTPFLFMFGNLIITGAYLI